METAIPGSAEVSAPASREDPVLKLLKEFTQMAERGELSAVMVGFVLKGGDSAIRSTPMAASMMNHLSRILDCKVDRMYDRAMAAGEQPRSPTLAMRAQAPAEAQLPRKVRRQVQAAQRKMQKKAKKKALSGPPLPAEA
jgi:hypothetical protein